jgi:AraC-like DNA-binding protein
MAFLYKLKTELENSIAIRSKSSYFEELYNLRLKIYQNPQRKWSIENLSHEINLSRSYFQYLYKNVFAISCTEDVINAKIAHAKILLSGTSLTVNQIAEKCGYTHTKRTAGVCRTYRREVAEWFAAEMREVRWKKGFLS